MGHFWPRNPEFTTIRADPSGRPRIIQIEDDSAHYRLVGFQRFIPHVIHDPDHPVKPGDILTPQAHMTDASAVFVGRVRTFRRLRHGPPIRQVEILGMPCRWWDLTAFKEYTRSGLGSSRKEKRRCRTLKRLTVS